MKKINTIDKVKKKSDNIKNLNKKRGSELVEVILITAISMILVITLFYPIISNSFTNLLANLEIWFNTTVNAVFGAF